jgi:hypothetical protein
MEAKMKKILYILLLAVFLIPMTGVRAQAESSNVSSAPGTWVASINIQNPSGSPANVTISFFNSTGTDVLDFPVTPAIPAGGSRSLYLPTDITALGGGQFSAVLSSDQPVMTVVNMSSSAPYTGDSYVGVPQGSTTQYFPGLYNNYYGFSSELVLQNSGTGTASIKIQFYNQVTGATVGSPYTDTIPANASKTYTLSSLSPALPSGNTSGLLSAVVTETTTQTIAGIASSWTAAYHGEFSSYNGFAGGATAIYVPALYVNYYHFVSSLTVQNIGTFPTDVTVFFSNGVSKTVSALAPGAAKQWYLPSEAGLPSGNTNGVFSAKITSASSGGHPAQSIVALVNSEDKTAGSLASYDSIANATGTVLCPVVLKAYYLWFSAETIQNVGTSPTNITITYPGGFSKTVNNVPANGTVNFIELASAGSVLPDGTTASATITSSGQPLVGVTQENSTARYAANPGDYLFSYSCTNQ